MSDFKILTDEEKKKLSEVELNQYILRLHDEVQNQKRRNNHSQMLEDSLLDKRKKTDNIKIQVLKGKLSDNTP